MFTLITMFTDKVYKFAMFTGKNLYWSLFLIKIQVSNFIKKWLQYRCFPVNIAKFLSAAYFIDLLRWLLFQFEGKITYKAFFGTIEGQCIYFCAGLKIFFLSSDRLSGRTDVTSNKVNFRPDFRQTFFWKNKDIKSFCGS